MKTKYLFFIGMISGAFLLGTNVESVKNVFKVSSEPIEEEDSLEDEGNRLEELLAMTNENSALKVEHANDQHIIVDEAIDLIEEFVLQELETEPTSISHRDEDETVYFFEVEADPYSTGFFQDHNIYFSINKSSGDLKIVQYE